MAGQNVDGNPLFTFAIISDTHIRPAEVDESSPFPVNNLANGRARYAIAAIAAEQPAFVLHLGDMVHPLPHLPSFRDACREAHEIFAPLRPMMHFIPGNHDIGDKPNPDAPAGPADDRTISQYSNEFGPSCYSFEHADCVFIGINSSLVNSGTAHEREQRDWLEATLKEHRARRIFLCTHYPPFIYSTDEQSHYDNYAEPGRAWLLELVARYEIEAVISGHVHQFFHNRLGQSRLYCVPPTSFIRQDYAEMYAIEPPLEFGRNDTGKFGYVLVDVFEKGHRLRVVPTDGAGLGKGEVLPDERPRWGRRESKIMVPLRHAWARPIDLPYNGPMEEFARKRTRNDYTLMRLQQMGISRVRVPLTDLSEPEILGRIKDYANSGIAFSFFCLGVPDAGQRKILAANSALVAALEIVSGGDDLADLAADASGLDELQFCPVFCGKSHSSKHEPAQGSKFAHSVSSGFKWEARDKVVAAYHALASGRPHVAGLVFQLNLTDDLAGRLAEIDAFALGHKMRIEVNVRLADANPSIANFDDDAIAERVCKAVVLAKELRAAAVQIDTFVDVDRGYNPRHGLLDRHYNFRSAGRALALQG
ncbi:MAG TPA: metallophosphoesterase [Hyphomicrobiaceae bacterium]|nr:metallophosphoesterase [Hyphomicrobiaceae bacterium]